MVSLIYLFAPFLAFQLARLKNQNKINNLLKPQQKIENQNKNKQLFKIST
jgi:hypothetical protein